MFQQHHSHLIGLGKGPLTANVAISTEKFICKIYGVPEVDTCNKARVKLFCIGRLQEALPPTSDAAKFHIMRSHYQASSSSDRNGMDAPGWSVSTKATLSATYPESLQGDHVIWLYEGVPQSTLQLQEKSHRMH